MDSTERFIRRKRVQEIRDSRRGLAVVVDDALVNEFLQSEVDWDTVQNIHGELDAKYDFELCVEVNEDEVQEYLNILENEFNDERFSQLLTSCRDDVLSAIVGPFGLGGIVSRGDKDGGNVDTIHNAREGTYATDRERQAYENREKYTSTGVGNRVHTDPRYRQINKETSDQQKTVEGVEDGYTDRPLKQNSNKDLDHIKSAKETHDDPARVLAELETEDVANIRENLTPTERTINRSKSAKSIEELIKDIPQTRQRNREKIQKLESKGALTRDDDEKLRKLKEKQESLDAFDADKAREADRKAKNAQNRKNDREYYTSKKFYKSTLATGASQGCKMGLQQAIGLVLCEFFKAAFDEIQDIYANGFSTGFDDGRFFAVLKERLSRVAARMAARWKEACVAFRDGFISGFLSNLVTVVINMFVRTGKRIVRVIREGFFSLLKAIKILCFPPEGMTIGQAAHEASKLIAAGLAAIGGIAVEQQIDNMIKAAPWLEPFADILTTVLVGGLTGLATSFIVYAIDKIDVFKINARKRHEVVMDRLETNLNKMFAEGAAIVSELAYSQ